MNTFVVDASVAAKWVLPGDREPLQNEAYWFLRQWADGKIRLIVPDLFWAEVANVLWKSVRRGQLPKETGKAALHFLEGSGIPTVPALSLLDSAFDKAVAHERTVYDSLYLALALDSGAQFVTADEKLANALAPHFPVKWLGASQLI